MLSIEECRKELEKHGEKHTDEEIREIRDTLYLFAKHQIRDIESAHNEKCNNLHTGLNGRTSGQGVQLAISKGNS